MLAALGFSTIGLFLLLTMTKRVSVLVALVLLPVLAGARRRLRRPIWAR